jgi:hypothetical protein
LIDVLAFVCDNSVGVKFALLLVKPWVSLVIASSWDGNSTKASTHTQVLLMPAVPALNSHLRRSDRSSACIGDDTRDDDQLTNQIALQVSQHAGVLITVNLHLERRNIISLVKVLCEIVSFVNLLHCFLKLLTQINLC